jgi:hypothetical protein
MALTETDLVVEDGTGLSTANTYVSLTDATEYHRLRGNDIWADADESDQCIALIRAAQYIDERWVFQSIIFEDGDDATDPQSLQFPRYELYDRNGTDVSETVPVEIVNAASEYALLVLGDGSATVQLSPTLDATDPGNISYNREKVGSLETEVRYDSGRGTKVTATYPTADRIVLRSGFLRSKGGGVIR